MPMPTTTRFGALTAESAASRYDAPRARAAATRYDAPRARSTRTAPDTGSHTTDRSWRAPSERSDRQTTRYASTHTARSTLERTA
jgi:hypothetical protein